MGKIIEKSWKNQLTNGFRGPLFSKQTQMDLLSDLASGLDNGSWRVTLFYLVDVVWWIFWWEIVGKIVGILAMWRILLGYRDILGISLGMLLVVDIVWRCNLTLKLEDSLNWIPPIPSYCLRFEFLFSKNSNGPFWGPPSWGVGMWEMCFWGRGCDGWDGNGWGMG